MGAGGGVIHWDGTEIYGGEQCGAQSTRSKYYGKMAQERVGWNGDGIWQPTKTLGRNGTEKKYGGKWCGGAILQEAASWRQWYTGWNRNRVERAREAGKQGKGGTAVKWCKMGWNNGTGLKENILC